MQLLVGRCYVAVMPVVHEYEDGSGFYIRSSINNRFVTFQIYESAEQLLKDVGYTDGDVIRWNIVKPLWEQGYIYTGKSETTKRVDTHLEESHLKGLDSRSKKQLRQFFETQERQSISVPDDVYSALVEWHNGKFSRKRGREILYNTDDRAGFLDSVREFRHSPLQITGLDSEKGDPEYNIRSKGRELKCVDLRHKKDNPDIIITFRGASDFPQALFVDDGDLTNWKVYGLSDRSVKPYYEDLMSYFPSIIDILTDLQSYDLTLEAWDFEAASNLDISEAILDCLQVEWSWCIYSADRDDGCSSHIKGTINLRSSIGYGLVWVDELSKKVVFGPAESPVDLGQEVSVKIQRSDGTTRAVDIQRRNESTDETEIKSETGSQGPSERDRETERQYHDMSEHTMRDSVWHHALQRVLARKSFKIHDIEDEISGDITEQAIRDTLNTMVNHGWLSKKITQDSPWAPGPHARNVTRETDQSESVENITLVKKEPVATDENAAVSKHDVTPVTVLSSPSDFTEGSVYSGVVDRCTPNAIINLKKGNINLGPIDKDAVGEEVTFEYVGSSWGKCLTEKFTYESYSPRDGRSDSSSRSQNALSTSNSDNKDEIHGATMNKHKDNTLVKGAIGQVKFFKPSEKYGFIQVLEPDHIDNDVFIHLSDHSSDAIHKKWWLEFNIEKTNRGLKAQNARRVSQPPEHELTGTSFNY